MDGQHPEISGLRQNLDEVDHEIVRLIAQRFSIVAAIAQAKEQGAAGIRDASREQRVLAGVEAAATELGVSASLVRRIFRELISDSVAQQASHLSGDRGGRVRVAFQGAAHGDSYAAARKYLAGRGLDGDLTGYRTFRAAVDALLARDADLAVLPIENTTAGSINEVYGLLREHDLFIVGEETWKVDYCLAGLREVPLPAVSRIVSDPHGLEQCSQFLRSVPQAQQAICSGTSDAMRAVADGGDPAVAAIGSPEAAAAHGLAVLRHDIADAAENYTRFVVLSASPAPVDTRIPCKTSLILATRHEEGALLRCLDVLSGSGHSLTKLESRPRPGRPWEYLFFLDFEGNVGDPRTAAALDELRSAALYVKVLGSYPAKALHTQAHAGDVPGVAARMSPAEELEAVASAPPPARRTGQYKLVTRSARNADTVIRVGDTLIGGGGFVVMAGPCSVESAEQIEATARFVRDHGAHVLRGGVFKPRTSPYAFSGLGWAGLDLLVAAGRQAGLPVVTEVMAVDQVQRMAGVADILQVGARNMQNFDLLREIGKVDCPVLLKRGLSSTVDEWLAAAEYVAAQGNQQVILCERGIRTFESATRNTLDLSAVVVVRERSHLPVIVDPSHGTGARRYVAPMAWAARAAGAHGLLVEVHPSPADALSDADQSLSFSEFAALMHGLAAIPGSPVLPASPGNHLAQHAGAGTMGA
ncbi:MAG TPA: bifunctional 3-deoxy-7-phosphoheptulonate synthase/chorismate mutase [Streptosporangiaceae bacterium]|nr:bifunctional 3-deoxy-7-phosphoheptulonate synthase/chorismate mutase [Streptosporangiaceae bacterium]